jgi:hypothetical protein
MSRSGEGDLTPSLLEALPPPASPLNALRRYYGIEAFFASPSHRLLVDFSGGPRLPVRNLGSNHCPRSNRRTPSLCCAR